MQDIQGVRCKLTLPSKFIAPNAKSSIQHRCALELLICASLQSLSARSQLTFRLLILSKRLVRAANLPFLFAMQHAAQTAMIVVNGGTVSHFEVSHCTMNFHSGAQVPAASHVHNRSAIADQDQSKEPDQEPYSGTYSPSQSPASPAYSATCSTATTERFTLNSDGSEEPGRSIPEAIEWRPPNRRLRKKTNPGEAAGGAIE